MTGQEAKNGFGFVRLYQLLPPVFTQPFPLEPLVQNLI